MKTMTLKFIAVAAVLTIAGCATPNVPPTAQAIADGQHCYAAGGVPDFWQKTGEFAHCDNANQEAFVREQRSADKLACVQAGGAPLTQDLYHWWDGCPEDPSVTCHYWKRYVDCNEKPTNIVVKNKY